MERCFSVEVLDQGAFACDVGVWVFRGNEWFGYGERVVSVAVVDCFTELEPFFCRFWPV